MRITVTIDDRLHEKARRFALEKGTTLEAVIEESLRERLMNCPTSETLAPVRLKTFGGRGVHPGVNLDGNADLLGKLAPPSSNCPTHKP